MTPIELPFGKKEGQRLEFKSGSALVDLWTIGREVVGMLNAEGGEIWVGLEEEAERATRVAAVDDPEYQQRRLVDYLIDAIEPSPLGREVIVELVPLPEAGSLLRVVTRPTANRKPYALLKRSGRLFLVRTGDRNRPMTREEVFSSEGPGEGDEDLNNARETVLSARRGAQRKNEPLLWLWMQPVRRLALEVQEDRFREYLKNGHLTENRAVGWTFVNPYREPELKKGRLVANGVTIHRNGALTFELPLASLYWKGDENEIYPFALIEYPVSAFRLAKAIYQGVLDANDLVLADAALFGVEGWVLRPYSPRTIRYLTESETYAESKDLVWEDPMELTFDDIDNRPDWCAYRLVIRRTYEAFGYREDKIPEEFDRKEGRLLLSE